MKKAQVESNISGDEGIQENAPATPKVRWEQMLPHEFLAARDKFPVCYAPYGLAEPHGAYNPIGLDWLKASALVEHAAQKTGGIVAPPFAWHIQEIPQFHDDGKGNGWLCDVGVRQSLCSSIPADLFYRTLFYQIRAFDARGFHAAILVTGHYGGVEIVMRKICEYYLRRTNSSIRLHAIADWECIDATLPHRGDHAGVCETSQLMALQPDFVDLSRRSVAPELGTYFGGSVDFDKGPIPSAEIGQPIVTSQIHNLCNTAAQLIFGYSAKSDYIAPDLDQTENIWRDFDRLTRKYWTFSYAQDESDEKPFDFPSWEQLETR